VVTASWREQAAEGESFTTYNLHVADWNTYYVSPAEDVDDDGFVWVHNLGGGLCSNGLAKAQAKYTKYAASGTGRERVYLRRLAKWTKASRSDVVKLANSNNTGPGKWGWVKRGPLGMQHQAKMSGRPYEDGHIMEYVVDGVEPSLRTAEHYYHNKSAVRELDGGLRLRATDWRDAGPLDAPCAYKSKPTEKAIV